MPKTVAIVGAGLAGAACANAFANNGFKVVVFEQGAAPAAGASGVPLAMFAPSVSADDAPHSRLLRRGVHVLLDELSRLTAAGLLVEGSDWALTGVLERCIRVAKKLPTAWLDPQDPLALQSRLLVQSSPDRPCELFHGAAGWVNPTRLIAAWLSHTHITLHTDAQIARLDDARLCDADVMVIACGYQTPELAPPLQKVLQPIRGQVEWGRSSDTTPPINGMGHWIEGAGKWLAGATFQRDECQLAVRPKDTDLNFEKLSLLRPELAKPYLEGLRSHSTSWVGIRTAQRNREPLIESMTHTEGSHSPSVWVCTGLGSRGLSLAAQNARTLLQKILRQSN